MDNNTTFRLRPIDWRWMLVTYCFLILFHLFPSFLIAIGYVIDGNFYYHGNQTLWPLYVWLGAGLGIVSACVGYQSRQATILEPGLASVSYVLTLIAMSSTLNLLPYKLRLLFVITLWWEFILFAAFLVGCGGAAFGAWMQARRKGRLSY